MTAFVLSAVLALLLVGGATFAAQPELRTPLVGAVRQGLRDGQAAAKRRRGTRTTRTSGRRPGGRPTHVDVELTPGGPTLRIPTQGRRTPTRGGRATTPRGGRTPGRRTQGGRPPGRTQGGRGRIRQAWRDAKALGRGLRATGHALGTATQVTWAAARGATHGWATTLPEPRTYLLLDPQEGTPMDDTTTAPAAPTPAGDSELNLSAEYRTVQQLGADLAAVAEWADGFALNLAALRRIPDTVQQAPFDPGQTVNDAVRALVEATAALPTVLEIREAALRAAAGCHHLQQTVGEHTAQTGYAGDARAAVPD